MIDWTAYAYPLAVALVLIGAIGAGMREDEK